MDRRREEADRAEHGPTRPPRHVRDDDEDERRDRYAGPLAVAAVRPVEDRAADQQPAHEVEPERGRRAVDRPPREVGEADEESDCRGEVPAGGDQTDDEEPADDRGDEPDEEEAEAAVIVPGGHEDQEPEREPRPRPMLER